MSSADAWGGYVPVRIELAQSEVSVCPPILLGEAKGSVGQVVAGAGAPPPYFLMALRMGYLPQASASYTSSSLNAPPAQAIAPVLPTILAHFAPWLPAGPPAPNAEPTDWWLDCDGLPLRWHVPTGVLHDLLAFDERPWRLGLHTRHYPREALLPPPGDDGVRATLFNALKEAAYCQQGSASSVMALPGASQDDLLSALTRGEGAAFERIAAALAPAPVRPGTGAVGGAAGRPRAVPFRLYVRDCTESQPVLRWEDVASVSRPLDAAGPDGAPHTLAWALKCLLPGVQLPGDSDSRPGTAEPPADGAGAGAAFVADVVIQGVRPPLSAPLAWLAARLRGADRFLTVVVLLRAAGTAAL